MLIEAQLNYLRNEQHPPSTSSTTEELIQRFNEQVDKAIEQLSATDPVTLTDTRGVGRAQIPSTVLGLLFHAAEHTQRHIGQLLVTTRILQLRDAKGEK
jgi:uncharacterized damage-inducible protein DinB